MKTVKAAREGWYSLDENNPRLLGSQCQLCKTYYFPMVDTYCKNPNCSSEQFEQVALSNQGVIWSYTNSAYQPPEPYIAEEPYEPYALAAVTLEREQITVLGQMIKGIGVEDINIGDKVNLVLETLYEDDAYEYKVWKWKPMSGESL